MAKRWWRLGIFYRILYRYKNITSNLSTNITGKDKKTFFQKGGCFTKVGHSSNSRVLKFRTSKQKLRTRKSKRGTKQHRLDKNGIELFYLSVGQQPAWLRLRSLASYRWTRGREREKRGEVGSRRGQTAVSRFFGSPLPSNGSGNDGRMHPSVVHRCNSNKSARARALFLGDNPFFLAPSSFLSRDVRSVRTFFSIPFEETDSSSLSLRCVARASGPISSWTSHHSITLSMPVRPCLPRAHCPCAADTRVVVRLIIVHQFLSTGCLAIEFDYREERLQYSSKLRVHSFYITQSKAKFSNSTFYKLHNLAIDLVTSTR